MNTLRKDNNKAEFGLNNLKLGVRFVVYLFRQFLANKGALNAAALTYTTLFAVVPLLTVTYTMISSIPSFNEFGVQIEDLIFENFIPTTGSAVRGHLLEFATQARSLTAVGIGFLIITAYLMIKTIEAAFNRVWRIQRSRKGVASFLLYWAVLSLGPLLLGLGFALTSYIASLPYISDATSFAGQFGALRLLPIITSAAAFTLLYAAVPNCHVPFHHALVGGFVVALIFEGAKQGFTLFVTQFPSYQLIYGAFAAVPLFLLWIYISWIIVLLGAELVRAISYFQEDAYESSSRKSGWLLLILETLWLSHREGQAVSNKVLKKGFPRLSAANRDEYILLLTEAKLIEKTQEGDFVLNKDLNHLPLIELFHYFPWPLPKKVTLVVDRPWLAPLNAQLKAFDDSRAAHFEQPLAAVFAEDESSASAAS